MLAALYTDLKAVPGQPRQVTGRISSRITESIIKVLVNEAHVLSSSSGTIGLEAAVNGSSVER